MRYTLDELQELFGRKPNAVSRNAKPLNFKRMPAKWRPIIRKAISFTRDSYEADPIALSLRQIHYHLVHAGLGYVNDPKHASKLTIYLLRARVSELIEWHMVTEGESTVTHSRPTGADPEEAIKEALEQAKYATGKDPWDEMGKYLVIFSEKRELGPQLASVADKYLARLVCTRGYGMWSRMHKEALYYKEAVEDGKQVYALFVTDHDPSGLDLNRFGAAILRHFWKIPIEDSRVMLSIGQIRERDLLPAPTKVKDPRAKWYVKKFGYESWEVDALGKEEMRNVLGAAIREFIDVDIWNRVIEENNRNMEYTEELAKKYLDDMETAT